ncbi:MAG: radical SAM protein [Bacteroidales bacterium]|jgi:histone acetyltransferase (RNA polymerase elongator complex component)|nr:radical SAM protein [Bacteroidales bacterium]MBQ5891154.1 radical SAM protein [Bacteroidales bacterium]
MKHYNIPIFIPELACPNRCIYCNQRHISGQLQAVKPEEIKQIIEQHLATFIRPSEVELAFFGGSFTGIDEKDMLTYLQIVQPYIEQGEIKSIRISTRPDYINEKILDILQQYNVKDIELGAQSLNEEVLAFAKRGHTVRDVENASQLIKSYGFSLGLQMMIGLPLDTVEKSKETAKKILKLGAESTRIYPTLVINNTDLADLYRQNKYKALSLDEAVDWTTEIYKIFSQSSIKILRVGLHPSEALINGTELLAGPFHVSFKELVLTKIWQEKFEKLPINTKTILVNPREINYAIGYNSKNKQLLQKKFPYLKFISDSNVELGTFIAQS